MVQTDTDRAKPSHTDVATNATKTCQTHTDRPAPASWHYQREEAATAMGEADQRL